MAYYITRDKKKIALTTLELAQIYEHCKTVGINSLLKTELSKVLDGHLTNVYALHETPDKKYNTFVAETIYDVVTDRVNKSNIAQDYIKGENLYDMCTKYDIYAEIENEIEKFKKGKHDDNL